MRRWTLLVLLGACAGKDADTDDTDALPEDPDPATVALDGPCALADDHGGFVVQAGGDGSGVQGAVADGVVPISVLEEIGAEGGCKLLRRNNPACDPACESGYTCDFDGSCVPYPRNQDLGTVTIRGLVADVSMEAVFPGNTYYDTTLADPPYTNGELVTLDMPGGTYGPLQLHGVGLAPHASGDAQWVVSEGSDLAISWEAPVGEVVRSEIAVSVNIDQHGASPASLYCTFEDTGQGVVPAALVDQLVGVGVTGFPSGRIERRTVDSVALPGGGCMDLTISAPLTVPVDVDGYTPCVGDEDCPDGEVCDLELQICEPA